MHRRDEVLAQECEMSAVHGLLSKLPENLDYDTLINEACELYDRYPPSTVASYGGIRLNDGLVILLYY